MRISQGFRRDMIIFVDDNLVSRLILHQELVLEGIENENIVLLETGENVLHEIQECGDRVRLIVLDVCLKGELDGFQVAKLISEQDKNIPVVLISAVAEPDWALKARAAGSVAFLQKPVRASTLLAFSAKAPRSRKCSDPCVPQPAQGGSALRDAVYRLDILEVARLLVDKGFEGVNEVDEETGNTFLHYVARKGNVDLLSLLLDCGANIDAVSRKGYTALHVAAWSGCDNCVKLLLSRGCSKNIRSDRGFLAVDLATEDVCEILLRSPENVEKQCADACPPSPLRPRLARRRSLSNQPLPDLRETSPKKE